MCFTYSARVAEMLGAAGCTNVDAMNLVPRIRPGDSANVPAALTALQYSNRISAARGNYIIGLVPAAARLQPTFCGVQLAKLFGSLGVQNANDLP